MVNKELVGTKWSHQHDANQGLARRYGEMSIDMINARMVAMGTSHGRHLLWVY